MSHYFTKDQKTVGKEETIQVELLDHSFTFVSASGMFSVGKLDAGTNILISYAQVPPQSMLLDLGCGWGAVGVTFAKALRCTTLMVDTNKRAIAYAKKNAKANNVEALCTCKQSDGFAKVTQTFDTILFNPPQHAGKDVCNGLITQAKQFLNHNGSLQVVCRHNVGGASFEKHMDSVFGNVATLCKKSGYRVYKSVNQ